MNSTKQHWEDIKIKLESTNILPYGIVKDALIEDDYYKKFLGKARNRTMIKNSPELYSSIIHYTKTLEETFKAQNSYKACWNFTSRLKYIVECDLDIEKLKCTCGKKYTWTKYCRYCPDYKRNQLGKPHTEETKRRMRLSTLDYLKHQNGQLLPRYNRESIQHIETYGKMHNLRFMHAENGGEFFITELGYFLDGYDPINNVAIEFDERHHFDSNGNLKAADKERELQIKKLLNCKFIRLKYDSV
jgi:hypothetical protein